MMRMTRKPQVSAASAMVMMSGVHTMRMMKSHRYAHIDQTAVVTKTPIERIVRTSPAGMATMHTAVITKRLKAAEPTIVPGPSLLAWNSPENASITFSRISGADEPSAINVRLATVAFHMCVWKSFCTPSTVTLTVFSLLVMVSMELMNTSAPSATPRKT